MKFLLSIISFLAVTLSVSAQNESAAPKDKYAECLAKSSSAWGSNCGSCYNSAKSYRINLKNVCDEKIDVKVAVQERSNRWRTFNQNNMIPGDSLSGYACEGTGKYVFWTRKAGDNTIVFPTEDEIDKEFNKQK
ncbi:MAG: hypothetical protein IPP71_21585 [Bacteroidetes bacterium]|nr:hypothetical protein [Bacteroidota bacterium]